MSLRQLSKTWDTFGRQDPLWAILSHDDKRGKRWDLAEFMDTGRTEIVDALSYVTKLQPQLARQRALDFGCGVGRLSQALAEHFEQVDGVDIAASMIEQARSINQHGINCRYHHNTSSSLSTLADRSFDFVYSSLTLQHMHPVLAHGYIRELCRVLRPGGVLLFDLPVRPTRNRSRLGALLSGILRPLQLFWLRKIRQRPVMDMFGSPQQQIEHLITGSDCKLADTVKSDSAGPDWLACRYYVTR